MTTSSPVLEPLRWSATITHADYTRLHEHLFQEDGGEHAAFLLAGTANNASGGRLLVREVVPVADEDFVAGDHSYRISPRATARAARRARGEGLALIWAHSHPGSGQRAGFSLQDKQTIKNAHPALLDITDSPVAAFVFGEGAIAGEIWLSTAPPTPLQSLRVLGAKVTDLDDGSRPVLGRGSARHARQILVFGEVGQARLRSLRVAVLGAGGGGSLIVEQLAHLGVGEIWIIDFDRVSRSNLSRIVGSRPIDALLRRRKVRVARQLVRRVDPTITVRAMVADASTAEVAKQLAAVDALFVATDTALARHAANAVAYQYLVPAFQVGAKVQADESGQIATIHTAARTAMPGMPCWHCQGAIPADRLRIEQLGEVERKAQDYLGGGEDIVDPSVISLNANPVSVAVTDFVLMFCGLLPDDADLSARIWHPLERRAARRPSNRRSGCAWCNQTGPMSAFGRGDTWPLPLPTEGPATKAASVLAIIGEKIRRAWSASPMGRAIPRRVPSRS